MCEKRVDNKKEVLILGHYSFNQNTRGHRALLLPVPGLTYGNLKKESG